LNPKIWFKGRTYHHSEFKNIKKLVSIKKEKGLKVSLCFPTLNVGITIPKILDITLEHLVEKYPLLDQVAIVDSHSEDGTVEAARERGVEVYFDDEIRPDLGSEKGKGEALWKSFFVLKGDIILWVDSDIENFHPRFVYGILGPLLFNDEIEFVKAFYRRPIRRDGRVYPYGGGRVTEILARPLLNLFYPELSYVLQPLSGEYGGRKRVLESIPFFTGYAVEIGLLIEIWRRFGLNSMAQVDLEERIHHNQPTIELGKMSFAILQAVLSLLKEEKRISFKDFKRKQGIIYRLPVTMEEKQIFHEKEIIIKKRPPISSLAKLS
jgi:glucosyl-3-phosphoglycerate synthase